MMKKNIFLLLLLMFSFTFVSATETYSVNDTITFTTTCISCGNVTLDYVQLPNSTTIIINDNFTKDGNVYTYSFSQTDNLGLYTYSFHEQNNITTKEFIITNQGFINSTGGAIIYSIGTMIILLLLFVQLYYVTVLPWKNKKNGEDWVIEWRKYLKLFLMFSTYITLLFLMYIGKGMSYAFLQSTEIYGFFNVASWVMIIMLLPLVALGLTLGIINFLLDKKIQQAFIRGVPLR